MTSCGARKRELAGDSLTAKAQELIKSGKSPVTKLPAPEEGDRAIRVGRPKITNDELAEVPVQVKAAGTLHKTKLLFRKEDDQWRIFAMSATYPSGEVSIDFEVEPAAEGTDPLDALVGKPFQFAGMTLDGRPLDLSRYQGKVVLVDFWATWCGPCMKEMPNVFANYKKYGDQGFDVIGVSVDSDLEALAEFLTKEKPPWAIVADKLAGKQSMGAKYQISAIPAFILIGRDGKVAAVNCRGKKLGAEVEKLLSKKEEKEGTEATEKTAKTAKDAKVGSAESDEATTRRR